MMKNQTVTIVPAETGAMVRAYANAPEFGYLHLQTTTESISSSGWIQESKRSHLLKGSVELLERFVSNKGSNGQLPGNIVITECLEDDIPETYKARLGKGTFEEGIEPFLKRAGKDGPVLTKDGKRILRFTDYDPSGEKSDKGIDHDPFDQD